MAQGRRVSLGMPSYKIQEPPRRVNPFASQAPRCLFHKYTASAYGFASFPRKRESRGPPPQGLDARLRGHDVLLAPNLRNGHLAFRKCWHSKSLSWVLRVKTGALAVWGEGWSPTCSSWTRSSPRQCSTRPT